MLREKIINAINEVGFDEYKEISSSDIIFADAVFASCKANTCGNYGQNYSCPPLSGDMAENKQRFLKYAHAIIINKIVFLGKYYEKMEESGAQVAELLDQLRQKLEDEPVMIAGPGGCNLCKECAAKLSEPCRFPEQKRYSLEGSGMDIVSMSRKLGMTYNAGDKKVGFFMMVLY
ncbi:DUF2284 domain-containing protein [Acetobacterium fimetarium]|uniref:DUF2284 domain-containing protein n=1 Tax=Acetobacterium fimetarium TaxID=52691 RepID=A0ABR6WTV7_9FIRM|nr:DUF2284 domain-containing protein [Acetobacterium fimetarium]MBC3804017.1 DUF2284 domain-containing protein [Acetobacterium fimetarium]